MAMKGVRIKCGDCGKEFTFTVGDADFREWRQEGKHIQDAMPYLTRVQRELLISQTCDDCWAKMFMIFEEIGA
jgi:hypothetical protein